MASKPITVPFTFFSMMMIISVAILFAGLIIYATSSSSWSEAVDTATTAFFLILLVRIWELQEKKYQEEKLADDSTADVVGDVCLEIGKETELDGDDSITPKFGDYVKTKVAIYDNSTAQNVYKHTVGRVVEVDEENEFTPYLVDYGNPTKKYRQRRTDIQFLRHG